MTFAALIFGDTNWFGPALAMTAAALLLLLWTYRGGGLPLGVRLAGAALKFAAIALLGVCLAEPLWSGMRAKPGANLFAIVVDDSRSLQIRDNGTPRAQQLRQIVGDEKSTWQSRLGQEFEVRRYTLNSRLTRAENFQSMACGGEATSVVAALESLRDQYRDRPLAGVLLLTDGIATDADLERIDVAGLPPVYPVVIGDAEHAVDLAVQQVAVSQTAFEDAPVTIRADIAAVGYEAGGVTARLFDAGDQLVAEETQSLEGGTALHAFRFQVRPPPAGVSFYRLEVADAAEVSDRAKPRDATTASREVTLANNQRMIQVEHGGKPQRVLYVSGRPNWEFKFLRRAVDGDAQIDLVGLIRIARREAKFDWRGRAGETGNAIFRGFKAGDDDDGETERYDEPVLVRLNTKDAEELRDGFPSTAEELYVFDAVVLDDIEADFFQHDQLALLERFVSERGGSLLMLGGQESFQNGQWRRTPVGDMLPVYLERGATSAAASQYRLMLTRDGWLQPWMRLRRNESDEQHRLQHMPDFHTVNRTGAVKPGASVLAHVTDAAGNAHPGLVVQRFGRGRCAALTIGDLWRWHLKRDDPAHDDMQKAWRQMFRWLVADVPRKIELRADVLAHSVGAVEIRARIRDTDFGVLENAAVEFAVSTPDGETIRIAAEPSLDEPGLYRADFVSRQPGIHRVMLTASDAAGAAIGTAETGFVCDPDRREFAAVLPNHALMRQLAEDTGGHVVRAAELNQFAAGLSQRRAPVMEEWTFPLWNQAWVFALAMGCLVGEWGLRRWKGLP